MYKTFALSYKLKNTYKVNSIVYRLKTLPIVKKLIPASLYAKKGIKTFANVLSLLSEVVSAFLWKFVYLYVMIVLPVTYLKLPGAESFIHSFLFLTVIGGFLNTNIFDPTKDKYYAMCLMRMDAKAYTLSNHIYFLVKTAVGLVPALLIFGTMCGVDTATCLVMPLFVVAVKLVASAISLQRSLTKGITHNENLPKVPVIILVVALLALAYVPPLVGYTLGRGVFWGLSAATAIGAVFACVYIARFGEYRQIYKKLLTSDRFAIDTKQQTQDAAKSMYLKKINDEDIGASTKQGYAFLHDVFMKRHKKLFAKSVKRMTVVELIVLAAIVAVCLIFDEAKSEINELILTYLPYFLFVMYMLNRGKVITQAMFMNCDHSMLTYRFYRQPKAILGLFTARLKTIIIVNLIPALVIALGLPLLLLISGGTDNPLHYAVLFFSIIAMSVFFSVHNLVLYYLLQPYNTNIEMKSTAYALINMLTYIICYFAIGKTMPTLLFGSLMSAFCVTYVFVALILAYRLAPKTFKLRN